MITVQGVPLLATVKEVIDLVKVISTDHGFSYLGKMKVSDSNIQVSCPFHAKGQEKHPSCGLTTRDTMIDGKIMPAGTFHCFTCGRSGNLEELISFVFGKNDAGMYGYKWLVSHFCAVDVSARKPLDISFDKEPEKELPIVSEEELEQYRYYHPYMWERKLDKRAVDFFDVGYDEKTNCLTFPVRDLTGAVRYVQRRSVATKFYKFAENVNKGDYVYGLFQASRNPERRIVITEAPIDAITAWIHGYAGIATCGLPITKKQLDILATYSTREYIIATDADIAGNLAAEFIRRNVNKILWRMSFNGKKDLNEMTDEDWQKINFKLFG